jgi:predicted phosphoribosyltransferase
VDSAIKEQLIEIEKRNVRLRGGKPYPNLEGKSVILVDDGIAAWIHHEFCNKIL